MAELAGLFERIPRRAKGMLLGLIAALSFTLLHTTVRYASRELHVFEITFFRYFIAMFFMLPGIVNSRFEIFRTRRLHLHLLRSVMLMISMLGLFSALTMAPIAMVTALSFVSPVFASVVAILLLRERSTVSRWLAVGAGVAGMLLIVRPGVVPLSLGPLLAIAGAIAWSVSIIVIKMMASTESSTTQITYMSVIVTPLTFLLAIWVWKWPSLQLVPVLLFMAVIATVGQFAYTKSFVYAEATALMPLDFTRMMWASLLGFLVFGEIPDLWSWIGGTIIFLSAVYVTFHESTGRATSSTPVAPDGEACQPRAAPACVPDKK
ncbi:DMT family transporter [Piscinibacter sakaiensis]|uniref:DMT family transporter n=1 Tax=Piscinibacter sakaiensis TaxID=1547922 RepID=UPI003AAD259F